VNIKRSPLCGRNFEYYSEDPYLAGEMGASHIEGLQGEGVACSVKHYAANNQETDRMFSDSVVDERALNEIYLAAFEKPAKTAKTIMCSYNKINGTFSAENKELLTDILRGKWKFDGLVVTDWGAAKDTVKGIKAGLDLIMPGGNPVYTDEIINAVNSGLLPESELDTAVSRILQVINFATSNRKDGVKFDFEADHALARKTATECAVLLKNDNSILPLDKKAKVAFIGEFAKNPRYQGNGSSFINSYRVDNALDCAKEYDIVNSAKDADIAVIFAGLPDICESEGFDRKNIDLPDEQNKLIAEVCAVQKNVVVVLHNGAPVAMPWIDSVSAVLEMYLGGEGVGAATVDLLFGDATPCGKLAETFPRKLEDNPSYLNFPGYDGITEYKEGVYAGYRYYDKKQMPVLFPFGYGLSYTTFEHSNLRLDNTKIRDNDELTIAVDVKNSGSIKAKEVVQLYVKPLVNAIPRPVRELKGFEKIELAPGETKTVTFVLSKRAFAYYNATIHDWHVETGEYAIEVGSSSRDIRLSATVTVQSTVEIPITYTEYSTIGKIMRSEKGRVLFTPVMRAILERSEDAKDGTNTAMGAAAAEMQMKMMQEMPLASLVNFGVVSKEQMRGIISALNT
jgi:beta-glucosidase